MHGVLYNPPAPGLPYLAVVLKTDEDDGKLMVVTAAAVFSEEEGETMISNILQSLKDSEGKDWAL